MGYIFSFAADQPGGTPPLFSSDQEVLPLPPFQCISMDLRLCHFPFMAMAKLSTGQSTFPPMLPRTHARLVLKFLSSSPPFLDSFEPSDLLFPIILPCFCPANYCRFLLLCFTSFQCPFHSKQQRNSLFINVRSVQVEAFHHFPKFSNLPVLFFFLPPPLPRLVGGLM